MKKTSFAKLVSILLVACLFTLMFVGCQPQVETFSVTIGSYASSNGTVSTDKEAYTSGETVNLTVTPKRCFEVSELKINGQSVMDDFDVNGGVYQFVITKDSTVDVSFRRVKWTLTISDYDTNKGSVTATDGQTEFLRGASVTITVTAFEGNKYTNVTVNENDVTSEVRANSGTYTFNITQNTVVSVQFAVEDKWSLSTSGIDNVQGTVTLAPFKFGYNKNEQVTITVAANEGYVLDRVMLGETDITDLLVDGAYTFNIDNDYVITADFTPTVTYTLSVSGDVDGQEKYADVTLSNDKSEYGTNEKVTLTIDTAIGYELSDATVNGTSIMSSLRKRGGSYIITMTENINVVLEFVQEQMLVNATVATFDNEIDRKGKVLLDFWGDWCTVCTGTLAPMLEQLVGEYYAGDATAVQLNVKVVKVRVSGSSQSDTTAEYSILRRYSSYHNGTFPFLILIEDGQVIGSLNGAYNDYSNFIGWLRSPNFT